MMGVTDEYRFASHAGGSVSTCLSSKRRRKQPSSALTG